MRTGTSTTGPQPLTRRTAGLGDPARPRIVHLGLGGFHRAHQAWYTARSDPSWGIAAFTGRSPDAAERLRSQDGVYTLVIRGPEDDTFATIPSIVEAHGAHDLEALSDLLARPEVAVVTLTITEAGYKTSLGSDGPQLDLSDADVQADLVALREAVRHQDGSLNCARLALRTAPGRLAASLAARRAAEVGPLAVVSCDNLPQNGPVTRVAVLGFAEAVDPALPEWVEESVSWVSTSVDRITPRTTEDDRDRVAKETGFDDVDPVVTEPFSSWVLAGDFPAGRPAWESAGAEFVDDLEPFERRKLWLLNGAHSLMAYMGLLRGHTTVAEALADSAVSLRVEDFWDAAARHLTDPGLDVPAYRTALRGRFSNPRIAHHLAQISTDGSVKLRARAMPVTFAELEAGRSPEPALVPVAAWANQMAAQHAGGEHIIDPAADRIAEALKQTGRDQTAALLSIISSHLAQADTLVAHTDALRSGLMERK